MKCFLFKLMKDKATLFPMLEMAGDKIFFNKEKWAGSLYSAYGNFEEWWNKQLIPNLMKEF